MLPAVSLLVYCLEQAQEGTGAFLWLPLSARTAVPAIKDAYFLCLANEKSF